MKINVYLWLILFIFFNSFGLGRTEALDVRALIEEALGVNPGVQAAKSRWRAARQRVVQAGALEDPMLGLEFEGIPTDTIDAGRFNDIEWSFTQEFPFPGKISLQKKIAYEEAKKARLEFLEKEREVIEELKIAYWELWLSYETIRILKENEQLLTQFSQIAAAKYEVGKAPQQDLLKAQVELAKMKNQILVEEQAQEAVRAKMNQLLARSPESPLGKPLALRESRYEAIHGGDSVELQTNDEFQLEQLLQLALEHRPELAHHASAVKMSGYELRLAKREYWPNFFTKIEAMQFQGTGLEEYDVMVGINIPWLWTRARTEGMIREARENLKTAQYEYESRKQMIFFDIKESHTKIKTAKSLYELYRGNVIPRAEQAVKSAEAGYQTEKIDFLMLIDSQRSLLEFQLEYERALAEYYKNLAELERNVGADLEIRSQQSTVDSPQKKKLTVHDSQRKGVL